MKVTKMERAFLDSLMPRNVKARVRDTLANVVTAIFEAHERHDAAVERMATLQLKALSIILYGDENRLPGIMRRALVTKDLELIEEAA